MDKIFKFLLGEGEIDGAYFGERNPGTTGLFWWRKPLREYLETHSTCSKNERAFLDELREKGIYDDGDIVIRSKDYGASSVIYKSGFTTPLKELVNDTKTKAD